jgi:hypothetical protein
LAEPVTEVEVEHRALREWGVEHLIQRLDVVEDEQEVI